jgi:hypothetical protein
VTGRTARPAPTPSARLAPNLRALSAGLMLVPAAACAQQSGGHRDPRDGRLPLGHAPAPTTAAITAADLMTRLYIFADDSMMGREAGTAGNVKGTEYIAAQLRALGLEPAGDSGTYFQTVPLARRRHDSKTALRVDGAPRGLGAAAPARNVVAVLRGSDPALRGSYVALGAHNDHVGVAPTAVDHDSLRAYNAEAWRLRGAYAGQPALTPEQRASIEVNVDSLRRRRAPRRDSIRNGADDDGSGSMALLEVAEALAQGRGRPKRSVLFVWHTAEEKGLLGSRYFTDHPTVPRDSIVAQINIDMIGRGRAEDTRGGGPRYLGLVGSRRLSTELGDIVEAVNRARREPLVLDYGLDANGHPENIYCRSDHYEYARYGIPVVFLFTGLHGDYHQVTDEPQYIDYPHYAAITQFVGDLTWRLANQTHRPAVDKPKPDRNAICQQ